MLGIPLTGMPEASGVSSVENPSMLNIDLKVKADWRVLLVLCKLTAVLVALFTK